jgi:hypothetical protein
MYLILVIILVLMLLGSVPAYPWSAGWGYYPSGLISIILIVLLVLFLLGRL